MSHRSHFRRAFVFCAALLVSAIGCGQDWQGAGSIESREYKKEIRDGNTVTATEFFHLVYSVEIKIEEVGPNNDGKVLSCLNFCNGKKHADHSKCDFSCDDKCITPHKMTVKGKYTPDLGAMRAATSEANALAVRGGGTVSPDDWSHEVSQALAEFRNECKKSKKWDMPHAPDPCSGRFWIVGTIKKTFTVRGRMRKVGYSMSRGMRTPIDEEVGSHQQTVATGLVPAEEPFDKNDWVACNCKFVPQDRQTAIDLFDEIIDDIFDEILDQLINDVLTGGDGWGTCDEGGHPIPSTGVDVTVTGDNMNTAQVLVVNHNPYPIIFVMPYGVFFFPSDPIVQIMVSMMLLRETIPAEAAVVLSANSGSGDPGISIKSVPFRWACTELAKHEPNGKVKFKTKPPHDSALQSLASITNKSRIRGPWDQARVWIYTDKATLDQINKRMLPPIDAGRYLMLLRDNALKAGVDFGDKAYAPCLDPAVLTQGASVDKDAIQWAVGEMVRTKPKELAKYVSGNASKFADLAEKDPTDGTTQVALIASGMLNDDDPDLQKAAAKMLLAINKGQRDAVSKAGGLVCARNLFASGKSDMIALGLDLFEAYGDEDTKLVVMASAETMKDEGLKIRAQKLLGQ